MKSEMFNMTNCKNEHRNADSHGNVPYKHNTGKTIVTFLLGFVCGIFITVIGVFSILIFGADHKTYSDSLDYDCYALHTKKGEMKLHSRMPADSVKILMGEPNKIIIDESWEYNGDGAHFKKSILSFDDGKLNSVSEFACDSLELK